MRASAFELLRILYRCLDERRPYEEAKLLFVAHQPKGVFPQYLIVHGTGSGDNLTSSAQPANPYYCSISFLWMISVVRIRCISEV